MLDWLTDEDAFLKLAMGCVVALVSIALPWLFFGRLERRSEKFRKLHPVFKIFLGVCFSVCVGYGSFKSDCSTNTTGVSLFSMRPAATFTTVSPTAFAIRNWNVVGAWEDSFRCEFTNGFVFPCGTNHLNGVEVVSQGLLWEGPFTPEVVASLGLPVELAPGVSGFNCEYIPASETNEAKYVFTWRDGYVNRDANNRIDGRIELRRGGDILVATNGVERLIPRVLPFEHNGYGQDDEWVAANFTNSAEIFETGYPQWVDNQVGEGGEFVLDCDAASGLAIQTQTGESVSLPLEWSAYYNEDIDSSYLVTASDINAVGAKTFTLTFTPDAGGAPIVRQIEVDVVKIRVEAEADWPSNKVRHVFGPAETARIYVYPSNQEVKWLCGPVRDYGSSFCYEASYSPTTEVVVVELNGLTHGLTFETIAPTNITAISASVATNTNWETKGHLPPSIGEVGAGMIVQRKLLPEFVSFANLALYEGECSATGVFGLFEGFKNSLMPHDISAGALQEICVKNDNKIDDDFVGVVFSGINTAWQSGGFTYNITNYWVVKSGSFDITKRVPFSVSPQSNLFSPTGEFAIKKYGWKVTRNTNDVSSVIRSAQ